jgi:hypothetical protein
MMAYFFAEVLRLTEPSQTVSIRTLLIVWRALLSATVLFVWMAEKDHPIKTSIDQRVYVAICIVAVSEIGIMFFMQKRWQTDSSSPADPKNLRRVYAAQLMLMGCSLAIVLYGLVVRLLGATLPQALPFYITGSFLLLYFRPRQMDTASK